VCDMQSARRSSKLYGTNTWEEWFAWYPVITEKGERVWWKKVYRAKNPFYHPKNDVSQTHFYKTLFDVLVEPQTSNDENGQGPIDGIQIGHIWVDSDSGEIRSWDGIKWTKIHGSQTH